MTPDEAFLQAIREAPHDDTPRLIYADWLEEHGQSDRAEFIRVQCRLARMPNAMVEQAAWTARAEELLRRHWEEWVGSLRKIVGQWRDRYGERWLGEEYQADGLRRFQRGFVTGISLEADSFLRHARELRLLTPQLNWLHLWGGGGRARALAYSPELEGLATLSFIDYYHAPLTAQDAAELASSPYLHGLSTLQLGMNSIGDEGVVALAQAPWLIGLTRLELTDNGLSDRSARALAESPYLVNLQILHLQRNFFSSDGVAALTNSLYLRRLSRLEFGSLPENIPMNGNTRL
jgi:uncharacterized protein (TIGR02996 family)